MNNWLQDELNEMNTETIKDRKEALKIEENQIVEIEIDFSKEWEKYIDNENKVTKKIIPIIYNGLERVFFLNVKNPLYKDLLLAGNLGQTKFKIMRTGQGKNTKYIIIKELPKEQTKIN